jgi:hypothetical protein
MAGNFLRETLDATRNGVTSLKSWTGQTGWNTLAIPLRWLGQEDALGYLTKLCLKKQNKLGTWLKWHSACLASKRPSLSIKPSTAKKKEKYIKLWLSLCPLVRAKKVRVNVEGWRGASPW